ncbi:unnamed protein product [Adineta ricciae]|uniref:Transmembrane protein n=1 Tax=Adineta ricciae TaxID=249248 RepID=A0A815Y3Z3_ADIRI|nr:unnamed protein product [Adineta ricciae]
MNDYLLVVAQNNNQPPRFAIQFAPYNHTLTSSQCTLRYPNSTNTFIYTVAIGKKQNESQLHFFFIGEHTKIESGVFIGMATFNNLQQRSNLTASICDTSFTYSLYYLNNRKHQEYLTLGVHPLGTRAFAFSNEYVAVFDTANASSSIDTNIWDGNLTWPDSTFIPHAVDLSDSFGVVAGFIRKRRDSRAKYIPMIYLLQFNSSEAYYHPYTVDLYKPVARTGTWQDLLTYDDVNVYSAKYDMSVSINEDGKVLVGMQFINRVFYFTVNLTNAIQLTFVSRYTNGRSIGNGKSIAWMNDGIAAVLINVYSLDYVWSASRIFLFDIYTNGYNSESVPLSVFPNSHQLLPSSFSSVFLNVVSTPSSLALLDNEGKVIIFSPTQAQYYPSVVRTGLSPFITTPKPCMAGTFKNKSGIFDCVLCAPGTKNSGNASNECLPCSANSFCPLGSVVDVPKSVLSTVYQVVPYPESPESTIFDEIIIHSIFSIGSGYCLLVSPLFWALVVACVVLVIIIIMEILKLCVKTRRSENVQHVVTYAFKHTDLIGDGKSWVGGLVSFSILVLVCFAYAFSNGYLKQYPIEQSGDSYFTCDKSMRNAKFDTKVQSLAIPLAHDEQEMFDLLNEQIFTLNIDFVNTLVNCDSVSIRAQAGLTWSTIRWSNCNNTDSVLTLSIPLSSQQIAVKVFLEDTKTIGALRIGMSGDGIKKKKYELRELQFYQPFYKSGYMLSPNIPVALAITKIINETRAMEGDESDYSGIYIPTFTVNINSLFATNKQYVLSSSTITTLTIVVSETPYYVKNIQQPIARKSEVIFRNLLFTVVCLEIFRLVFLLYKLLFKPIYEAIMRKYHHKTERELPYQVPTNGDLKAANHFKKGDEEKPDFTTTIF